MATNGNGMTMSMKGEKLVIEIDCSKKALASAPMSNSGKNRLVASTGGFVAIAGTDLRIGLNVTSPKD